MNNRSRFGLIFTMIGLASSGLAHQPLFNPGSPTRAQAYQIQQPNISKVITAEATGAATGTRSRSVLGSSWMSHCLSVRHARKNSSRAFTWLGRGSKGMHRSSFPSGPVRCKSRTPGATSAVMAWSPGAHQRCCARWRRDVTIWSSITAMLEAGTLFLWAAMNPSVAAVMVAPRSQGSTVAGKISEPLKPLLIREARESLKLSLRSVQKPAFLRARLIGLLGA